MKAKLIVAIMLAAVAMMVFAAVAYAAVSQDTIMAILDDADDNGMIDGDWTKAEINAALEFVRNNPTYQQYTDYEGILEDYLASLQAPGEEPGELAFTGGEILMLLGAGAGLAGSGALLRRRRP
jgi:hypothetical protein